MVKPRETTWNDIKAELLQFDRTGLLGLLKDLYALRPEIVRSLLRGSA